MKYLLLLLPLVLLLEQTCFACQTNYDCTGGAQCIKSGYDYNGVCQGGYNSGNSYDQKPFYNQFNPSDRMGQTCTLDSECGLGRSCVKLNYAFQGTCE